MNNWHHKSGIEKVGLRIVKLLEQNGFKAFWVGGTVRSLFLKQTIDNLDIATSATPEQTEKLLKRYKYNTKPVGKTYGTILVATKFGPIEITTFRKEGKYLDHRHPIEVTYINDPIIDSARRDFTVNAIYYNPVSKELLDPHNGQLDLKRKLLKFVGNPKQRIDEDALRMLRAARFYTQLGFKLEQNSFAAIKTRAKYIQKISGERIKSELDKIFASKNRSEGLRILDELSLLQHIMPEVTALKKIWHKSKRYHLEGNVYDHTMLVAKNISPGSSTLTYAALYHDAGKATTAVPREKDEGIVNAFPNHENISGDLFLNFSKRIKMGRKETDLILWIIRMHMKRVSFVKEMSDEKKFQLASHKYFPELIEFWKADTLSNLRIIDGKVTVGIPVAFKEGTKLLNIITSKKKLVEKLSSGGLIKKYINISDGPTFGKIKSSIARKIISQEIKNEKDLKKYLFSMQKILDNANKVS